MEITIDTRSTTTGGAVILTGLTQEIGGGIPVSFIEGMESELEDFGEGLDV